MNNNISFTGINSLYIGKKLYSQFGSYPTSYGIKRGNKDYTIISLKCHLNNDKNGTDLDEFRKMLEKCQNHSQAKELQKKLDGNIDLIVKRFDVRDNKDGNISNSNFILNGIDISPNDRKILSLFTYLAALTRKIKTLPGMSAERNKYVDIANKSIHEEAMRFIDNMY